MEYSAVKTGHKSELLETKNQYLQRVYDQQPLIFRMPDLNCLKDAVTGMAYLIEHCDSRKGDDVIVINKHGKQLHNLETDNTLVVGEKIPYFNKQLIPNLRRLSDPIPKTTNSLDPIKSTLKILEQLNDIIAIEATTSSGVSIRYDKSGA